MQAVEIVMAASLGIGLAAASGFRVFVPAFVMSLAAASGHVTLGPSMDWLGSPLTCVVLGVATAVEIAAYFIPWVDNLLDAAASPAAVVAGALVASGAASQISGLDPIWQWGFGIVAGGGTAGAIQATTVATRAASTLVSGGITNPVVSTAEAGISTVLSIIAIVIPLIAALIVIGITVFILRRWLRRPANSQPDTTSIPNL